MKHGPRNRARVVAVEVVVDSVEAVDAAEVVVSATAGS
jgi:hypothetical protein